MMFELIHLPFVPRSVLMSMFQVHKPEELGLGRDAKACLGAQSVIQVLLYELIKRVGISFEYIFWVQFRGTMARGPPVHIHRFLHGSG